MNEFTLILNENDMKILNDALVNMPFKIVAPLINKINEQIAPCTKNDLQ